MRVLDAEPVADLDAYVAGGGGTGLETARNLASPDIIDLVAASGLRGRGGAGFPTGTKWETVALYESDVPTTVVVNAAEGEPGSFKDRAILRANPFRVLEGALIAARAVDAPRVVVATKSSFTREIARLQAAIGDIESAGWAADVEIDLVRGPSHYLFGEETALLEVVAGRPPFPRIAPPYRRGDTDADDLAAPGGGEEATGAGQQRGDPGQRPRDPGRGRGLVPRARAPRPRRGPPWSRSPATHGVTGWPRCPWAPRWTRSSTGSAAAPEKGRALVAALSGVANPILPAVGLRHPARLRRVPGRRLRPRRHRVPGLRRHATTSSPSPTG